VKLLSLLAAGIPLLAESYFLEDEAFARKLNQQYLELTRSWTRAVKFTPEEMRAMREGKQWERQMMESLPDFLGRRVLTQGEPSWERMTALYPGKILDRTILGGYSDPRRNGSGPDEEFAIWWNGAVSANLWKRRLPQTVLSVAHMTTLVFRVGEKEEIFGRDRRRSRPLTYEEGWLPVVQGSYEVDGVRYSPTYVYSNADVLYVRWRIENTTEGRLNGRLITEVHRLDRPDAEPPFATDDASSRYRLGNRRVTHSFALGPREARTVVYKLPYRPVPVKPPAPDEFEAALAESRRFWKDLIARGTQITVPEERINRIWRALLVQNFLLADGPRFTYGSGLRYNDSYYPVENGFGTHVLAMYGYKDYALGLLPYCVPVSVDPKQAGRKYQNRRALPFHHLLALYRLTGDTALFHRYKDEFYKVAEEIIADRRITMSDVDGAKPLHWGFLPPDKPGVDIQASTQSVYCTAHNITNAQGLQDAGDFLVAAAVDPMRGERYRQEAAAFRSVILSAMGRSVIRLPDRPPFVDLQTLYFAQTPDYGPDPYDHLALGRLQGTYYHYWADMQFQFNFFNAGDSAGAWIADYVSQRGGKVLGLTRARPRPGQPYGWINAVYNGAYYNYRLRQGNVDEFLLGFYSRLAFAMSRYFHVSSEGQPFIGYNTENGGPVDADHPFPNSASNSETLSMLRQMLVQEELRDSRPTGIVHLARGAPRAWIESGKPIRVERALTFLGEVSFEISRGKAWVRGPHPSVHIHFRRPVHRVSLNGAPHKDFDAPSGVVRVPSGAFEVHLEVQ